MYEEQLTALKSTYSNLTIAAKMELNCILHYYKFKSSSEIKNGNTDERKCNLSKKLLPENVKYLESLMNIIHEMTADYNELADKANDYHLVEIKRNVDLLLPYTDPCVDLYAILKKCRLILVNHEKIDPDWISKLDETLGRLSSEFLKIQDLVWNNKQCGDMRKEQVSDNS